MAVNRFNNNMFQFEDFDMSGIMNPELVDVMEMRKEANLARGNATDQYEADVADFKDTLATEAEQGIASLPDSPNNTNAQNYYDPTLFGYDINLPDNITAEDFQFEDIDMTGMVPDMPIYTNPYAEVFDSPAPAPAPAPLPDLGVVDYNDNVFEPTPAPNEDPYNQGDDFVTDDAVYNPTDSVIDVDIPVADPPTNDYQIVDPETGGDLVLVPGDPNNPVIVRDPETGELPPGYNDDGPVYPPGTIPPEVYIPPPPPPAPVINPYTNRELKNPYTPFERPLDNVMAGYTQPMDPSLFGSTPGFEDSPLRQQPTGMKGGGRVPMGNNNMLNSGLSRLPLNQQNDTLTQVFQSGFRPRR